MLAADTSVSNASSGASSSPNTASRRALSNSSQSKSTMSHAPSSSAGASSRPSSSRANSSQKSSGMASGSSRPRSPPRIVSALQPPAPPQQEISEKVRDAFEDIELGNVSRQESLYSPQAHMDGTGGVHASVGSRNREYSRGRQPERNERNTGGGDWDEKRGLGMIYGDNASASGPSNTRLPDSPQQACSGTIQAPIRTSSLTPASFPAPQPHASSFAPPPPYSTHSSFSSSALPSYPNNYAPYSLSVRRMLLIERIRPWLPFLVYAATIVGFALAISFWKEEVFGGLDELAQWLRAQEEAGYAVMFFMIFLTCIPPIPLYSTLQILSGYTFGAWTGGVVSYFSALFGAIFVFWISRSIPALRRAITSCMSHSRALQRVVRAISKRPSLLFLVRLAPYPYNVLNALLAGCPSLTFQTYTYCTALSLLKVIIHTSVGAGIKNFAQYHTPSKTSDGVQKENSSDEDNTTSLGQTSTVLGIVLCLVLALYLTYVARRAVDEELDDDDDNAECTRGRSRCRARMQYGVRADDEESAGFLDEPREGLGSDFAAFVAPSSSRGQNTSNREGALNESGEMVERIDSARLGSSSPVPLSSLSATPYGPPEWAQ